MQLIAIQASNNLMKFFITAILVYKWNIEATLSAQQFRHNYTKPVKPLMKGQKKQPEGGYLLQVAASFYFFE